MKKLTLTKNEVPPEFSPEQRLTIITQKLQESGFNISKPFRYNPINETDATFTQDES